jgi:hypothetical protein
VNPGDVEVVQIVASWIVVAPIVVSVVIRDERRLAATDPDLLARAWPPASRDAAVLAMWMFGFNPLYVLAFFLVHFCRTRGRRGVWRGIAWTAVTVAAEVAALVAVAAVADAYGG